MYLVDDGFGQLGPCVGDQAWRAIWAPFFEDANTNATASASGTAPATAVAAADAGGTTGPSNRSSSTLGLDSGMLRLPIVGKVEWAVEPARAAWWNAWVAEAQALASTPSTTCPTQPLSTLSSHVDPPDPTDEPPPQNSLDSVPRSPFLNSSSNVRSGPARRPFKIGTPEYKVTASSSSSSPAAATASLSSSRARTLARTRIAARFRSALPATNTSRSVSASSVGIVPILGTPTERTLQLARRVYSTPPPLAVRPTHRMHAGLTSGVVPVPRRSLPPQE